MKRSKPGSDKTKDKRIFKELFGFSAGRSEEQDKRELENSRKRKRRWV